MRKVTLKLQMRVVMSVDQINDTTTAADILDTEIIDYEIEDRR
jgi:hypothetical protein